MPISYFQFEVLSASSSCHVPLRCEMSWPSHTQALSHFFCLQFLFFYQTFHFLFLDTTAKSSPNATLSLPFCKDTGMVVSAPPLSHVVASKENECDKSWSE